MRNSSQESFFIDPFISDVYSLGMTILEMMGIDGLRSIVNNRRNQTVQISHFHKAVGLKINTNAPNPNALPKFMKLSAWKRNIILDWNQSGDFKGESDEKYQKCFKESTRDYWFFRCGCENFSRAIKLSSIGHCIIL